jgi:serine protease AprX
MAELNIVFRLRFAVALTAALCLLLVFSAGEAGATQARHEYIVQLDKGTSPATGKRLVRHLGGRVTSRTLRVINGFGASLSRKAVARLKRHPRVKSVSRNSRMAMSSTDVSGGYTCPTADATTMPTKLVGSGRTFEPTILSAVSRLAQPMINSVQADKAWWRATGRGVGVAVIDTGVAGDLQDFARLSDNSSRVIASAVTNPCATDANDHYGHGTHVAGLIAGNSLAWPTGHNLYGRHMGVAPRAHIVSVKVSDDDGNTTVLDVINGIQFAVDHKSTLGIRVVNLSLSSTVAESYRTDPLDAAVEQAWFNGLTVVAAAGNEGAQPDGVTFAPANDPWVITAGALDDKGTWVRGDDALAPWSSRGLTQDGVRKPDVLAPGVGLVSTLAPGSDFADLCPACVVEGRYFRAGGTSMATAVVSGAAALLLEEHPDWTPDQVKGALVSTLDDVPGAGGVVNSANALSANHTFTVSLPPNELIDSATRMIDWTRASFRRVSFRDASGTRYSTSWSRASFRCECGFTESGEVDPTRVSFRRVSFRKTTDFGW